MELIKRFAAERRLRHVGTIPLETDRLILRRFKRSDAAAMFTNWACDPDVTRYLTWRAHKDISETEDVIDYWESRYRKKDFYEWAIVLRATGFPIGSIGLTRVRNMPGTYELGYAIGKNWWGNGICAEASAAVIRLMFESVGCDRLIAMHAMGNPASGQVMKKCGMQEKPCPPEPVRTENGTFLCRVYELCRDQYSQHTDTEV